MRSPEDREPTRDICEPVQDAGALTYELVVRLAPPHGKRTLVIRFYEDGREVDWVMSISGPSLVQGGRS